MNIRQVTDAEFELLQLAIAGHPVDCPDVQLARERVWVERYESALKSELRRLMDAERLVNNIQSMRDRYEATESILEKKKARVRELEEAIRCA